MRQFPRDPDFELGLLLIRARDAVYKARKEELAKYNITPIHSTTMFFINALGDKATLSNISKYTTREYHTVYELLRRMEKAGLVKRGRNLKNKALTKISLTEKGKEAYLQSTKRESVREIFSALSKEEQEQLRLSLIKIRDKALTIITAKKALFP